MGTARTHWMRLAVAVATTVCSLGCASGDSANESQAETTAPTLQIFFPKMFSAFIPDSEQAFQIPAIVAGTRGAAWECSDPEAVSISDYPSAGGVMFTMRKAGKFKITARSGLEYGEAELVVTEATQEQLSTGFYFYNRVRAVNLMGRSPAGTVSLQDASCSTCHADDARGIASEPTPQQAGGYSDDELEAIVSLGQKPAGGRWKNRLDIPIDYSAIHRWPASEEEYQGLVTYMRSFEPKTQGTLDLGTGLGTDGGEVED